MVPYPYLNTVNTEQTGEDWHVSQSLRNGRNPGKQRMALKVQAFPQPINDPRKKTLYIESGHSIAPVDSYYFHMSYPISSHLAPLAWSARPNICVSGTCLCRVGGSKGLNGFICYWPVCCSPCRSPCFCEIAIVLWPYPSSRMGAEDKEQQWR